MAAPPQVHRLIEKSWDTMTGVCRHCGPVDLVSRGHHGRRVLCCSVARAEQRGNGGPAWIAERRESHGLTAAEAKKFIEDHGGACEICGSTEYLNVDHDHVTDTLRGPLCRDHNFGLRWFHDSIEELQSAIEYLKRHQHAAGAPDR